MFFNHTSLTSLGTFPSGKVKIVLLIKALRQAMIIDVHHEVTACACVKKGFLGFKGIQQDLIGFYSGIIMGIMGFIYFYIQYHIILYIYTRIISPLIGIAWVIPPFCGGMLWEGNQLNRGHDSGAIFSDALIFGSESDRCLKMENS